MKKTGPLLLLCVLCFSRLFAQTDDYSLTEQRKTVLFLIPFFSDKIEEISLVNARTDDDIYDITPFQLVAFWEGARLAIDEFEQENKPLKVIVRDVSNDSTELLNILNDSEFMQEVDLIVGPFFGQMFKIAARYAKQYEIPILNPFSSKTLFLNHNEFAYKLMPSAQVEPSLAYRYVKNQDLPMSIMLWVEDETDTEIIPYIEYFKRENIPYMVVKFENGVSNLTSRFKQGYLHLVIVAAKNKARVISNFRQLSARADIPKLTLVIPEDWLQKNEEELDIFNRLTVHFFSNYYVDYQNDITLNFVNNYIEKYASPPSLARFSFQGYDITRYFLQALFHRFDLRRVQFVPVALNFDFHPVEEGGYENKCKRFLRVENFEIKETVIK
ncbi:MAG: hypothetical protein LBR51_02945 [Bacteroidales bacterium]|jgi:hypothetical protein|nr:hypothetical protein [Bacteroidales bacterium]